MTPAREEAIADCKYAKSLGETALKEHIHIWEVHYTAEGDDHKYRTAILEIKKKLGTPQCLLEEHK